MSAALDPRLWGEHEDLEFRLGQAEADLFVLRQQLRRVLSDSEDLQATYGSVLESMPQALVLTDRQGRVRGLNRAAEALLGMARAQARDLPYASLCPGRSSPAERLRSGQAFLDEVRLGEGDAERRLESEVFWIRGSDGEPLGCVEMLTDRTETLRLRRELEDVQGLAAMGRMAAVAAHEIRNPLGGVAGFLDLLERTLGPEDPRRAHTRRMREGIESLERLVAEFLDFTRPAALERVPADLREVARRAIEELAAPVAARGVRLEPNLAEAWVLGDPDRIGRAVSNLLRNALEASRAGDILRVDVTAGDPHQLSVADQGRGVDPALGARIFEPFVTGKARGSGLGLALTARTAQVHGGSIDYENLEPAGARFRLSLPALRKERA